MIQYKLTPFIIFKGNHTICRCIIQLHCTLPLFENMIEFLVHYCQAVMFYILVRIKFLLLQASFPLIVSPLESNNKNSASGQLLPPILYFAVLELVQQPVFKQTRSNEPILQ